MVEESKITCEHNDHARIPTTHEGDCSRPRNSDIPNKNEKYEAQAIPTPMCFSQNAIRSSWHDMFLTYVDSRSCIAGAQQGE
jgi:hypothetical protein